MLVHALCQPFVDALNKVELPSLSVTSAVFIVGPVLSMPGTSSSAKIFVSTLVFLFPS